jgi:hypothetical protein
MKATNGTVREAENKNGKKIEERNYLDFLEHCPRLWRKFQEDGSEELETGVPVTHQHNEAHQVQKANHVGRLRKMLQCQYSFGL